MEVGFSLWVKKINWWCCEQRSEKDIWTLERWMGKEKMKSVDGEPQMVGQFHDNKLSSKYVLKTSRIASLVGYRA
jgi:hypothetical protein